MLMVRRHVLMSPIIASFQLTGIFEEIVAYPRSVMAREKLGLNSDAVDGTFACNAYYH